MGTGLDNARIPLLTLVCVCLQPKDSPYCWHPQNFALTNQDQSDDYGYGTFNIFASEQYVGVFTILIAVGDSQSGIYRG